MSEKDKKNIVDVGDDENIVDWDGPDDPQMPLNWAPRKRYVHAVLVSVIALVV